MWGGHSECRPRGWRCPRPQPHSPDIMTGNPLSQGSWEDMAWGWAVEVWQGPHSTAYHRQQLEDQHHQLYPPEQTGQGVGRLPCRASGMDRACEALPLPSCLASAAPSSGASVPILQKGLRTRDSHGQGGLWSHPELPGDGLASELLERVPHLPEGHRPWERGRQWLPHQAPDRTTGLWPGGALSQWRLVLLWKGARSAQRCDRSRKVPVYLLQGTQEAPLAPRGAGNLHRDSGLAGPQPALHPVTELPGQETSQRLAAAGRPSG